MPSDLPADDLVVLDLSRYGPGLLAAMMLGDMGADVIHVEEPLSSLPQNRRTALRDDGRTERELPGYAPNRNKRSIVLDLKSDAGRATLLRLAERADVILEGYRPGVATRLGVDYAALSTVNPRLVYCSISGFGQSGPYRTKAGHDLNYMAMAGAVGRSRARDGTPLIPGLQVGDFGGGTLHALVAIMMALRHRDRTGEGQFIDAAMTDGLFTLMTNAYTRMFMGLEDGRTWPVALTGAAPYYQIYPTADGRSLSVCANEFPLWRALCQDLGTEHLIDAHQAPGRWPSAIDELRAIFAGHNLDHWLELLADAPVFPILDLVDVSDDPQVRYRDVIADYAGPDGEIVRQIRPMLGLTATPGTVRRLAPRRGEHTAEVLAELGYAAADIAALTMP